MSSPLFSVAIIGGGPAGTGPLVRAACRGLLPLLLESGIAVIEAGHELAVGSLKRYGVNADSFGTSFLESVEEASSLFRSTACAQATLQLGSYRTSHPPLHLVAAFLKCLGGDLLTSIRDSRHSQCFLGYTAESIRYLTDGSVEVCIRRTRGRERRTIRSRSVVLALGGHQSSTVATRTALRLGLSLDSLDKCSLIPSDRALSLAGRPQLLRRLDASSSPRVVILGGSHSAFSAAWMLTDSGVAFETGAISILHCGRIRIFYGSRSDAANDRYADFTDRDVCPTTRRLHRFGGLRGDGRELWRRVTGRSTVDETRVHIQPVDSCSSPDLARLLADATVVIPAFGYLPRTIPIFDSRMMPLVIRAEMGERLVDGQGRVMLLDGTALPNVFALGLATGLRPGSDLGGEPSFDGQVNGVWLYQHGFGDIILQSILGLIDEANCANEHASVQRT